MKLDANQMAELNQMAEKFTKNTGIELDVVSILTSLGTKLSTNEDFRNAFTDVYKEALNDVIVPGVMKSIKNGKVIENAGYHFDKVMEVIWDNLAPEEYQKEDEEYTKDFLEKKEEVKDERVKLKREIDNLGNKIDKLADEGYENLDKRNKNAKKLNELNKEIDAKIEQFEDKLEEEQLFRSENKLFGHMLKDDYNKIVREAFRNNASLAGESVPSYKLAANNRDRDITLNRALLDSEFINANQAITWDEYSENQFHSLVGTVSESYMILNQRYKNLGFFKKLFSKEARELRGEMSSTVSELNSLQEKMIRKGIMEKKIDVVAEMMEKAETIRDMPAPIKDNIEKAYKTFSDKARSNNIDKASKKEKYVAPEKIKRIEINEVEDDKDAILPIEENSKVNEPEMVEDEVLFGNF